MSFRALESEMADHQASHRRGLNKYLEAAYDPNYQNDLAAQEDFYQMRKKIEYESKFPSGYWAILSTPSYRRGAFLSCFVQLAELHWRSCDQLLLRYHMAILD